MTKEELEKEAEEYAGMGGLPKEKHLFGVKVLAYIAGAEPREKRIAELEKENALLKGRNEGFEQQIMGLLIKYEEVYKRFPDLKSGMDKAKEVLKENAELKEKYVKNITDCDICDTYCNSQLTKAKEIIRELVRVEYADFTNGDYSNELSKVLEQAEQFLNSEVENV